MYKYYEVEEIAVPTLSPSIDTVVLSIAYEPIANQVRRY